MLATVRLEMYFLASEIHLNIFWHMEAETEYIFNFRASLFTAYIEYVFK